MAATNTIEVAVLDRRRVGRVDPSVGPIVTDLARAFAVRGGQLVFAGLQRHGEVVALLEKALVRSDCGPLVTFPDLDPALGWCENRLLRASGAELDASRVELRDHELLRGVRRADAARLERQLRLQRFEPGSLVLRRGDPAGEMLVVVQGHLSVTLDLPDGGRRRLATVSSGMVLGELTIMSGGRRTADVWADTAVECYVLSAAELDRLGRADPALKVRLLENLLRMVSRLARRLHEEQLLLVG